LGVRVHVLAPMDLRERVMGEMHAAVGRPAISLKEL
jgi:hypothetical protein